MKIFREGYFRVGFCSVCLLFLPYNCCYCFHFIFLCCYSSHFLFLKTYNYCCSFHFIFLLHNCCFYFRLLSLLYNCLLRFPLFNLLTVCCYHFRFFSLLFKRFLFKYLPYLLTLFAWVKVVFGAVQRQLVMETIKRRFIDSVSYICVCVCAHAWSKLRAGEISFLSSFRDSNKTTIAHFPSHFLWTKT